MENPANEGKLKTTTLLHLFESFTTHQPYKLLHVNSLKTC
jgi:hypothetical protein